MRDKMDGSGKVEENLKLKSVEHPDQDILVLTVKVSQK